MTGVPFPVLGAGAVPVVLLLPVLAALLAWAAGVFWHVGARPVPLRRAMTAALAGGVLVALVLGGPAAAAGAVLAGAGLAALRFFTLRPRAEADWTPNEARMPWFEQDGEDVTIHEVRNSSYGQDGTPRPAWETRTYRLGDLRRVWYAVVPFLRLRGGAHALVSFEFSDGRYLGLSIEARKEVGEAYAVFAGLFRRFELIYLFADERDLIGLRSHVRGEDVFLYPLRVERGALRRFLLDVLDTANELRSTPRFYNALTNTCLTRLVKHLNAVREKKLGWRLEILFPALSDRLALAEGLLDTDRPLAEARRRHRVDPTSVPLDAPDFSGRIRAAPPPPGPPGPARAPAGRTT